MSVPELIEITVIHDADGVVVIDKPPGLETTGRTPEDPRGVQHHLTRQLRRRVWAVHQLDRDTSGAVIFVRRRPLVAVWQERLKRATKRYLAVVHGAPDAQRIETPLAYDDEKRRWVTSAEGKPARTDIAPQVIGVDTSLVEAQLHTGRTHQVRVHLASIGHPLIGERRYRDPPCDLHPRHALHAHRIELGEVTFEAPLPDDLRMLLDRLGLRR